MNENGFALLLRAFRLLEGVAKGTKFYLGETEESLPPCGYPLTGFTFRPLV